MYTKYIQEVNRLRQMYRKDLPLYTLPTLTKKTGTKRKRTGDFLCDDPKSKKNLFYNKLALAPSISVQVVFNVMNPHQKTSKTFASAEHMW